MRIYRQFAMFGNEDRFEKISHMLVMLDRERIGRQSSPRVAIIDRVKTTQAGVTSVPSFMSESVTDAGAWSSCNRSGELTSRGLR